MGNLTLNLASADRGQRGPGRGPREVYIARPTVECKDWRVVAVDDLVIGLALDEYPSGRRGGRRFVQQGEGKEGNHSWIDRVGGEDRDSGEDRERQSRCSVDRERQSRCSVGQTPSDKKYLNYCKY